MLCLEDRWLASAAFTDTDTLTKGWYRNSPIPTFFEIRFKLTRLNLHSLKVSLLWRSVTIHSVVVLILGVARTRLKK